MLVAALIAVRLTMQDPAPQRVAVEPLQVSGDMPEAWRSQAERQLVEALTRGSLVVERKTRQRCSGDACREDLRAAGALFLIRPEIRVDENGRDFAIDIRVFSLATGDEVSSIEGRCELCGMQEAADMLASRASGVQAAIRALVAADPTILLETSPSGAKMFVDGVFVGESPVSVRVAAGEHTVMATREGSLTQTATLMVAEGTERELRLDMVPAPVAAPKRDAVVAAPPHRPLIIGGSVGVGLGLAVLAAGAVLIAIDQRPYESKCQADLEGDCRYLYGTRAGGIAAVSTGVALSVGGGVAVGFGIRRRDAANSRAALRWPAITLR